MSTEYESIKKFAKRGIYGENTLRKMVAENQIPGFYAGKGFRINVGMALEMFEKKSREYCKAVN